MKRRDALKTSSIILGYAITGGTALAVLNGCEIDSTPDWLPVNLSAEQAALVEQLSDTILPATANAPGATIAQVVRYIDAFMDCYNDEDRNTFLTGLTLFESFPTISKIGR